MLRVLGLCWAADLATSTSTSMGVARSTVGLDHTTLNAPHLVRSGKLSNVGRG